MSETEELAHPLDGFALNVRGVKCFDEEGSGVFRFAPITFIIGKNNSGKSSVLDVLQECIQAQGQMFKGPLSRVGATPYIEVERRPDANLLKRAFPADRSSGNIPGRTDWSYAVEKILPFSFVWVFNQTRGSFVKQNEDTNNKRLVSDAVNKLANSIPFPFTDLWTVRILAERDVQPEARDRNRNLSSTGGGLTNLVRAFINSEDLPRHLVEVDFLRDLNEIYLGDSEFSEIICQENEDSGEWEIFLRDDSKGDIRLSQSGSSLRTVFLVLAFLRLYPKVQDTGQASNLVFCLEEPENNLHPALLRRLIDFLAREREDRGFSLVITTHSPICIDLATKRDDATILHVRGEEGRTVCENVLDYAGQSSILEDLDVRGSDILQANGIIWVEGPSDRVYINKWIEVVSEGNLREGAHYTFMFYGGKVLNHFDALPPEELPKKIAMLAVNRNIAVVMDSDRRPKPWRTKAGKPRRPQMQLNATKREIIRQVEEQGGYAWVTAGKEIENYIPNDIWDQIAGRSLTIEDEYEDVPAIPALSKLTSNKVDLAHKAEGLIGPSAIISRLDLKACLEKLCGHIRNWNGMN
ncbi:ATP-dependent nuclease [Parasedimentitalea maritima]|uniref:AAA family ATPase n=1 Tax=Parasedimentitalea maritima TaxID=2578117 RepID=A0A6A4RD01_9RHOB|nr:ATP-binding protein [Zongyanglinia marina]KAE9625496.1 AAA family ATPase [Zongyanglinia marina]